MAGAGIEPTDSKSVASLLDPECDIPFDVHFEIEDNEGVKVGKLGGHKALLALKSPVFKAMLFGPMKEVGEVVKVKGTSALAFKTLLFYIHEVEEAWLPWTFDVLELVQIMDLAERFNLAGLKEKTISHVHEMFFFPKERLLEVARVAEGHHVHNELSESLLQSCGCPVVALIESPEDYNQMEMEWAQGSPEETGAALRLLARVDQSLRVYNIDSRPSVQKMISNLQKIARMLQPRARLNQVKKLLESFDGPSLQVFLSTLHTHTWYPESAALWSLKMCQKLDAGEASRKGIPLSLDTLVEAEFTHGMSVQLHLDLLVLARKKDYKCGKSIAEDLWGEFVNAIDDVKPIFLSWFSNQLDIFCEQARRTLSMKLDSYLLNSTPS